jgi:hypothetical protein
VHVQVAVAQAYADQRSTASFSASNTLARAPAGGQFVTRLAQAQADASERRTDPNLFVLPAVQQTRYESLEVQLPALSMQSGLLSDLAQPRSLLTAGGLRSEAPTESPTTLADQTLRALAEAPANGAVEHAAEASHTEPEDEESERQRRHLAQREAMRQAQAELARHKGQFGFSRQLKLTALSRSGQPAPRA